MPLKATKGASETFNRIVEEREKILAEGFVIAEISMALPYRDIEQVDKGDVAAVIARTNPNFK